MPSGVTCSRWSALRAPARPPGAAEGRQLIHVHAQLQARVPRRLHQAPRVLDPEHVTLGEDVGEGGLGRSGGPDSFADLHPRTHALELRQHVVAAEARDEVDGVMAIGARDDVEPLEFVRDREAVAGLRLDGRRAEREEAIEPRQQGCDERGLVGAADAAEARADTAARGGDLRRSARDALLELPLVSRGTRGACAHPRAPGSPARRGVEDLGRREAGAAPPDPRR